MKVELPERSVRGGSQGEAAVLRAAGSTQLSRGQTHRWTGLSDHPSPVRSLTISEGLLGASA